MDTPIPLKGPIILLIIAETIVEQRGGEVKGK